ncbi:MAG TPA: hypothetical protein VLA24_17230, partial [Pseudomonadales bacterium]|nr:hypothetical protein [Pseudomonadales bacterium]
NLCRRVGGVMNELISMVSKFAPAIGTALGGPLGGMAVSALASRFGVEDEVKAVTAAIKADPEAAMKLKQLEVEKFKAVLADKANARDREAAIVTSEKAPLINKLVSPLLAVIVVTAWVGIQYTLLNTTVPAEMRELVARVLGTLDGALMVILSYYFGASTKE